MMSTSSSNISFHSRIAIGSLTLDILFNIF